MVKVALHKLDRQWMPLATTDDVMGFERSQLYALVFIYGCLRFLRGYGASFLLLLCVCVSGVCRVISRGSRKVILVNIL